MPPLTTRTRPLALLIGFDPQSARGLDHSLQELGFEVGQGEAGLGDTGQGGTGQSEPCEQRAPELVLIDAAFEELPSYTVAIEARFGGLPPIGWLTGTSAEEGSPPSGITRVGLEVGLGEWEVELEHAVIRLMGPFGGQPVLLGEALGAAPATVKSVSARERSASLEAAGTASLTLLENGTDQNSRGPRLLVLDRPGWRGRSSWAQEFEQLGHKLVEIDPVTYDPEAERDARGLLLRDEFEAHDLLRHEADRAELANLCRRLPVLVLSSRSDPLRASRFAELGAAAYLIEPLSCTGLLSAMERARLNVGHKGEFDALQKARPPGPADAERAGGPEVLAGPPARPCQPEPVAAEPARERDLEPAGRPSGGLAGLPWLRLDDQRRVRGWNSAGARLFGEVDGSAWLDFASRLASEDARANCALVIDEVLHHGLPQCVEWPVRGEHGETLWIAWDVVPTGADEVCLFGLSARLREQLVCGVESARDEVEAQLLGSGECLLVLDAERGVPLIEAGPTGAVWGRSVVSGPEAGSQVPLLLNLPEGDRPEFAAALARARRGYAVEVLHGVGADPERIERPIEQRELRLSRLLPLHPAQDTEHPDAEAQAVVVLTAAQSRGDRLPGPPEQARLPRLRPRLSTVLGAAPIVLFSVDRSGLLRLSEPLLLQQFGARQPETSIGSVFKEFGDVPLLVESVRRALGGESCSSTVDIGGRQLETSFAPVHDDRGRVESVTGVAIDVTSRSHAEEQLKLVVEATSSVVGQGFFRSLVRYLTRALDVRLAYIAELPDRERPRLRMLCLWSGTEYSEGYDYDADGTPDGRVLEEGIVHVPDGLQLGFGTNSWVSAQGVKSYLGVPILDSGGVELGVLGVMHTQPLSDPVRAESILRIFAARAAGEIERQRTEQAVAESEARWRSLVQNAPDLICMLNRNGRVLFSNKPLGAGPDGPTKIQDLVKPESHQPLVDALEAVLADGKPRSLEHELERLDGRWVWFSSRIGLLERGSGPGAAILIGTDITRRKEAQAKLEFRVEVEQLVTAISARFINLNHEEVDEGIRTALAQLGALTGVDRAHLFNLSEGGAALVRTHAWVRQGLPGFLGELRDQEGPLGWVLPAVREGRELFLRSLSEMGRDALDQRMELAALGVRSLIVVPMTCAGERVGFLGFDSLRREVDWDLEMLALLRIVGDVFAQTLLRKRAEESRSELETQLRQAQKLEAIGTLAGGIAHDFNNLLTGILGYAGILRRRELDPESRERAAIVIEKAAQRGAELTSQLLGFARKSTAKLEALDLHGVVADVCELMARTMNKNIVVRTNLTAERSTVMGDRGQVQAVVLNLAVNARDSMPNGGTLEFKSRCIDLCSDEAHLYPELQTGRFLELRVRDTGTGIRPELLDRVFEPFFTTKEPGAGTGMGLAMVYGIVREHRGVVRVDSEINVGTEFRLLVPLETSAQPVTLDEEPYEPQPGSGCVLVVDDEAIVRTTAGEMLRELGYEVLLASNGLDGVRVFERLGERIDVVLLDLIMPEMGGSECFRELRKLDADIPIVLSSGWGYENLATEFPDQGGLSGLVRKPYQLGEFSMAIARAIAERQTHEEPEEVVELLPAGLPEGMEEDVEEDVAEADPAGPERPTADVDSVEIADKSNERGA